MAKISWSKALTDYLKDDTLSYADIAKKYGVSKQAVTKRAVKEEWQVLRTRTLLKVDQMLPEKIGESIAEVKARQVYEAKLLQKAALEALRAGIKPENMREVVHSIVAGIKIERKVLGLDDPNYKDPNWEKFRQFSFIFNMTPEELERFTDAAAERAGWTIDKRKAKLEAPQETGLVQD